MLTYTYDIPLVAASIAIALMASFTGLTVTNGISALPIAKRKAAVGMAAIVIGAGIWSMHFVAILAMQFPIAVAYDPQLTLASVLIAILMAGCALLLLHFAARGPVTLAVAGALLGSGILAMHVIGMMGIRGCSVEFGIAGHAFAAVLAMGMGILAIWIAYRTRTRTNIFMGTCIFGFSVVIVHFTAMVSTGFIRFPADQALTPSIDSGNLALIVIVAAFLICGAFLLSAATFLSPAAEVADAGGESERKPPVAAAEETHQEPETGKAGSMDTQGQLSRVRVPYESDRRIFFLLHEQIAAIRAEGHYTVLYSSDGKHFCPWSISETEKRLSACNFLRTHRSYLVNIDHVSGFERNKDSGRCLLTNVPAMDGVPVSRTRVDAVRHALGI